MSGRAGRAVRYPGAMLQKSHVFAPCGKELLTIGVRPRPFLPRIRGTGARPGRFRAPVRGESRRGPHGPASCRRI